MDTQIAITGIAATPIIVALVAAIGGAAPSLPRRCYPLLAVLLGILWNTAASAANGDLGWPALVYGVVTGLAASGLYSAAVKPALEGAEAAR